MNVPSTSSGPATMLEVSAVSLKLSEFWPEDPEICFLRVEAQLRSKSITADQTKFDYVVTAQDNRAAAEIKAVLVHPPEQDNTLPLKKRCGIWQNSAQQDQELLNITDLGDRKPAALLRHLKLLDNDAETIRLAFFMAHRFYHKRFGPAAYKCKPGCLFSKNQAIQASRPSTQNQGNVRIGRQ